MQELYRLLTKGLSEVCKYDYRAILNLIYLILSKMIIMKSHIKIFKILWKLYYGYYLFYS